MLTIHTLCSFRVDPHSEDINKSRSAQLSHTNIEAPTNSSNKNYKDKKETASYEFESDEDSVDLSPPPPHDCSGGSGSSICDGDNNESLNVSSASDGDGAGSSNNEMQVEVRQPLKTCGKCGCQKKKWSYTNDEWFKIEDQKRICQVCIPKKKKEKRIRHIKSAKSNLDKFPQAESQIMPWTQLWSQMRKSGWVYIKGSRYTSSFWVHPIASKMKRDDLILNCKQDVHYFSSRRSISQYAIDYLGWKGCHFQSLEAKRKAKRKTKLEAKRKAKKLERLELKMKVLAEEIGLLKEDDPGQDNKKVETLQTREQGRMQRQVNDTDAVVLLDWKTGQTIINCTQLVGDQLNNNMIKDNVHSGLLQDKKDEKLQLIDVRKADGRFGNDGRGIVWDYMPEGRDVKVFAETFVQLACVVAEALANGKKVLLYCKNGRSRSPAVVATFYILFRGVSLGGVKMWFKEAYPTQRPLTASVSASFPNLERFECILNLFTECLKDPTTTVRGFNLAGKIR